MCARQSEACLADSAGPGQGHEPVRGSQAEDLAKLVLPTDQL